MSRIFLAKDREKFLAHHGRLGQRKGVKNGPPYPLDRDQLSAREKAAQILEDGGIEALNKQNQIDNAVNIYKKNHPDEKSDLEKSIDDVGELKKNMESLKAPIKEFATMSDKKKTPPKADLRNMSNEDLKAVIERLRLERDYDSLTRQEVTSGRDKVDKMFAYGFGALTLLGTGLTIANEIKKLKK